MPVVGTRGRLSDERESVMIATHNINVDGVWYKAGEEYPTPELDAIKDAAKALEGSDAPVIDMENVMTGADVPATTAADGAVEEKTEKKPSTSRRKKITA